MNNLIDAYVDSRLDTLLTELNIYEVANKK